MPLEAPVTIARLPSTVRLAIAGPVPKKRWTLVRLLGLVEGRLVRLAVAGVEAVAVTGGRNLVGPDRRVAAVQMRKRPLRNAAVDRHSVVVVPLGKHFAIGAEHRQQTSVVDARLDVDVEETMPQHAAHGGD